MINWTLPSEFYTETTLLKECQLNVCDAYDNNVLYPLLLALLLMCIRWFVIYRMDKESRAFRIMEFGTDIGIILSIIVSIVWIYMVR